MGRLQAAIGQCAAPGEFPVRLSVFVRADSDLAFRPQQLLAWTAGGSARVDVGYGSGFSPRAQGPLPAGPGRAVHTRSDDSALAGHYPARARCPVTPVARNLSSTGARQGVLCGATIPCVCPKGFA